MRYGLGIDLGTSFVSAAVWRTDRVELMTLGDREAAVPALVHVDDDGTIATGATAARRAGDDRSRTVRDVRRRIGDDTPILVAGTAHPPHSLLADQLRHVAETVVERQGSAPASVVVTHPASWGPFKVERLQEAVAGAGLDGARLVAESLAAASDHVADRRPGDELVTGARILVCDLGGSTFSTEVLQQGLNQLVPVGPAATLDRLGGNDFDQVVFDHVRAAVAGAVDELDRGDPVVVAALHRLRQACAAAKEALSERTDADIPVSLPGLETVVRLTRTEFEAAIRPIAANAVAQARRTITEAGLEPTDLDRVLVVGGSAPVPLVRELLAGELGLPVVVGDNARFATVRGAARLAAPTTPATIADASTAPTADRATAASGAEPAMADWAAHEPVAPDDDPTRTSLVRLAPLSPGALDQRPGADDQTNGLGLDRPGGLTAAARLGDRARGPLVAGIVAAVLLVSGGGAAATFGAGMFGTGGPGTATETGTNLDAVSTSSPESSTTSSPVTSTGETDGSSRVDDAADPRTSTMSSTSTSTGVASTRRTTTTRPTTTSHHTTTTHRQTTETTAHHTTTTTADETTTETTAPTTTSTTDPEPTLTISPQPSIIDGFTTLIGPPITTGS
ncbi:MAG: Hsp70 family protein [Actinomycetota bacterium]